ncbi:hypothetical protein PYR74_09945 [Acinetobacter bereziniae]|nr:hypothetical protein PYR74_09945 [Acinetobacter bereziniae]
MTGMVRTGMTGMFMQEYASIPAGYPEFEAQHLQYLRTEAGYGTDRLQNAYVNLPKGDCKNYFWSTHSADLKEMAQFADQAIEKQQGETYEHSPT